MDQPGPALTEATHQWVADTLQVDPRHYPATKAAMLSSGGRARSSAEPDGGGPAGPKPPAKGARKEPDRYGGQHQANPFDAPEAHVEIERLTLPKVQQLAVEQAQNAANDFSTAINSVKSAKKAQADAEQAERQKMITLVIAIALMPAGPLIEAAATALAGKALQNQLADVIINNAASLEKKFGTGAADKAFNVLASEAVTGLAERFDPALAKKALNAGVDKLKETTVKFAASSDKGKSVESFLNAIQKSANGAMHNLTDVILTTTKFSEAVAYYHLFAMPLQSSFEAALSQQVDDMLSEINDVMAEGGKETVISTSEMGSTSGVDEIVRVDFQGRKMLAHVSKLNMTAPFVSRTDYGFQKWVTPDMYEAAAKLAKEDLTMDAFKGQHVPAPNLEPGERIVAVDSGGTERLMLIMVEDKHGFFSTDYGVRTFKEWAESADDVRAFRSRGAMQNGGIDKVPLREIKGVPRA